MNRGKNEITVGLEQGMEIKKLKNFELISQLGEIASIAYFPAF